MGVGGGGVEVEVGGEFVIIVRRLNLHTQILIPPLPLLQTSLHLHTIHHTPHPLSLTLLIPPHHLSLPSQQIIVHLSRLVPYFTLFLADLDCSGG